MPKKRDFKKLAVNHAKFKLFMLKDLPLALISGVRVRELSDKHAKVSIPFKYWTKNPFRSMYFAAQSMAAELSTAALALNSIYDSGAKVSMLVFDMKAHFSKKARNRITFTCNDGERIVAAVQKCIETGQGVTVDALTVGLDEEGDEVARFNFVWTFKTKK